MAEKEYIEREEVLKYADWLGEHDGYGWQDVKAVRTTVIKNLPAADVRPVPEGGIGEMSDGYHTFNGLYYQRMVLFAALVIAYQDMAWKSWKHEDGNLCFDGGWFIVGIDTPKGNYTYHYEDKYWNWFECEELPVAKHWDGHTEEDVTRLLSLDVAPVVRCQECKHYVPSEYGNRKKMCVRDADWSVEDGCYYGFISYPEPDFFCADGAKLDLKEAKNE